jgi:O-acetyl-ADP-ribose deacetylase (regulator of RNase III)
MIIEHKGDLLSVEKGIIVHGCNAQGVMGSGVARLIRDKYPTAYTLYRSTYESRGLKVGEVIYLRVNENLMIANAITQQNFGGDPRVVYVNYERLRDCFSDVAKLASLTSLPVHFPLIGCGLANGDWNVVSKIIDEAMPDPIEKHLWVL